MTSIVYETIIANQLTFIGDRRKLENLLLMSSFFTCASSTIHGLLDVWPARTAYVRINKRNSSLDGGLSPRLQEHKKRFYFYN